MTIHIQGTMNKELDCFIIGFALGALIFLWVGYELRKRVERWHTRSVPVKPRRDARTYVERMASRPIEQSVRRTLKDKPRIIPIVPLVTRSAYGVPDASSDFGCTEANFAIKPRWTDEVPDHVKELYEDTVCQPSDNLHWSHPEHPANVAAKAIREDAIAALVGSGFKRAASTEAVDACTLDERASGLDQWVAAAFRRVSSKP